MKIVAVVNQKGGAGKTTLAMNLAGGLNRRGQTLVLDLDPQGSAVQWASQGSTRFPAVVKRPMPRFDGASIRKTYSEFDYVVMDCPPSLESGATLSALRACHLAIIPVLPSPVDLWASLGLPSELELARQTNPSLRSLMVINQLEPASALSSAMHGALEEFGLAAAKTAIRRRAVYRTAALDGVTVYELGRRAEAAVNEFESLLKEVTHEFA
jgi:chromosome partitioning protein